MYGNAIFNAFDHCKSDSVLLSGSYDEFFVITDKGEELYRYANV